MTPDALPVAATLRVDGEPALYSGPGRTGVVRVTNQSPDPITIAARTAGPDADDHRLAVYLPNGTLSAVSRNEAQAVEGKG